jgi:hypothetical protein
MSSPLSDVHTYDCKKGDGARVSACLSHTLTVAFAGHDDDDDDDDSSSNNLICAEFIRKQDENKRRQWQHYYASQL